MIRTKTNSNNFMKTFKFVHRIMRMMGLLPTKVAKNGRTFVRSRFWTGYSVILFISLFVLYVNCVALDYMVITMTDTARVMYIGGTVPIFLTLAIGIFRGVKNRNGLLKIANSLVEIEENFQNVGIRSSYKIVKYYIWAETAFIAALLIYRILMGTFLIDFTFCLVTDAYWQDIYRIAVTQHFSTYILFIYKKFQEINSFLEDFRSYIKQSPSCPLLDFTKSKLNVAFNTYLQLFDVRKELNDIFGSQLLFYLLNNFYEMTILFYMGVENILGVNFFHSSLLMWIITVVWPIWCLFVMIICIELCLRTKQEAIKTAKIIHQILQESRNSKLNKQLEKLSSTVISQKFTFTICGLFPLNYTIIYDFLAASVSYVIMYVGLGTPPTLENS